MVDDNHRLESTGQRTTLPDTARILEELVRAKRIPVSESILSMAPPTPGSRSWDRVEGMLLGLAIGDALGNTTEGMMPAGRRRRYGEIREYLPNRHAEGRSVGLPSDDTQLAFWTLEQLIEDGGYVPANVARRLASGHVFGIGSAVSDFVDRTLTQGLPWEEAGVASAGNGALMRIAPILVPHLRAPSSRLWADTALATMTTHNDAAAISASVAFVAVLSDLLAMRVAPGPGWWLARFSDVADRLEPAGSRYRVRGGPFAGFDGRFVDFVRVRVADAWHRELDVLTACNEWYSGAFLLETVPSALYTLMRHGDDPVEALVRAVNDTKDNDTVAAIVGAAVGALHGSAAFPARWRGSLLGRTEENDDGRAFQLIERAQLFRPPDWRWTQARGEA
jgi:ADP-ribosylglycohydrolase